VYPTKKLTQDIVLTSFISITPTNLLASNTFSLLLGAGNITILPRKQDLQIMLELNISSIKIIFLGSAESSTWYSYPIAKNNITLF